MTIYIYSYPRCGNTLLRYIIEYNFRIKTLDYFNSNELITKLNNTFNFTYKDDSIPIKKRHQFKENELKDDDLIIFIRRNIYELIGTLLQRKDNLSKIFPQLNLFCSPLETHNKNKILTINYEDLLNNDLILNKINDISKFIGKKIDKDNFENFKNNIDEHRNYVKKIYVNIQRNQVCSNQTPNYFINRKNKNDDVNIYLRENHIVDKYFKY